MFTLCVCAQWIHCVPTLSQIETFRRKSSLGAHLYMHTISCLFYRRCLSLALSYEVISCRNDANIFDYIHTVAVCKSPIFVKHDFAVYAIEFKIKYTGTESLYVCVCIRMLHTHAHKSKIQQHSRMNILTTQVNFQGCKWDTISIFHIFNCDSRRQFADFI